MASTYPERIIPIQLDITQGVRAELAGQGTLVIAVMPGTVDTEMSKDYPPPKVSPVEVARATLQAVIDPDDRPAVPILSLMLRNITIRTVLVYTMPEEAKQAAIRDIVAALEAGALRHNIARRFPLTDVAAREAQDSG